MPFSFYLHHEPSHTETSQERATNPGRHFLYGVLRQPYINGALWCGYSLPQWPYLIVVSERNAYTDPLIATTPPLPNPLPKDE